MLQRTGSKKQGHLSMAIAFSQKMITIARYDAKDRTESQVTILYVYPKLDCLPKFAYDARSIDERSPDGTHSVSGNCGKNKSKVVRL